MRYYQNLNDLGERKYPTAVHFSLPHGRTELPNSSSLESSCNMLRGEVKNER